MAAATTGKKKTAAKSSTGKKTAAKGKTAVKNKKETVPVKYQHREVWIIMLFFSALIYTLAVIGIKGILLEALAEFTKGILGSGMFILPVSLFASSMIILFAHGKPVASKIVCVMLIPVLFGALAHLLFCDIELTSHVIPTLYRSGIKLDSGGVIAGSIAALLSAAISTVGAIIVITAAIIYCVMHLSKYKLTDVLNYFVVERDKAVERREEKRLEREKMEAEEERIAEEEAKRAEAEAKRIAAERPNEKPVENSHKVFDAELGYSVYAKKEESKPPQKADRKRNIDIPLDAEPPFKPVDLQEEPKVVRDPIFIPSSEKQKPSATAAEFIEQEMEQTAAAEPEPFEEAEPQFYEAEHYEPDYESDPVTGEIIEEYEEIDDIPFETESIAESEPVTEREPVADEKPKEISPAQKAIEEEPNPESEPVVVDTHQLASESSIEGEEALLNAQETAMYEFPPVEMLHEDDYVPTDDATEELRVRSHKLADTLQSFGVKAQIINVIRGPSVTRYEIVLERGVKYSRLTSLQNDIALALGSSGVRIAAIPDKSAVGIEVPNKVVQTVYLREVLTSKNMADNKSKLAFALGKDITGTSIVGDIAKMPHMLIAGTTGSGKSVCINSIIVSMLYRASPEEVKLIMIDPKMVELGTYNGIPHLLVPVVTDYKKAAGALNWAVMEMDRRYKQLFDVGARDIDSYNRIMERNGEPKLPRIVIIIDELADLMMMAAKEIEESICRIAQKARAAGMHLVIATQRPSADVLTGLMKSNISSRIAFAVSSQIESRIILDQNGAEQLIGRGDMLFFPLGYPKPVRVQGCYLSTEEVEEVTEFIKLHGSAEYSDEIIQHMERSAAKDEDGGDGDEEDTDELFFEAVDVAMQSGQASTTMLQKKLRLGYARASRIIDQMEERGIVGPYDGAKPRKLVMSKSDWLEMKARRSI